MPVETVGVVIGTFGGDEWRKLAEERALPSVLRQTRQADIACHIHGDTLAEARNQALRMFDTTWIVVVDADDELAPGYIEAMLQGSGDLRQPATQGVYEDGTEENPPSIIPPKPLWQSNYIVIGAMVRRQLALDVGGFREEPCLEDWSLWARCWLAGAEITVCPEAVYRIFVTTAGRNFSHRFNADVYKQLRDEFRAAAIEKGLI